CYLCHTHDLHVPFPTRRSSDLTQDDPSNISTETHICGMSTDYMPIEEREANAALIAAAPDMYEALKQAKREMWDMARHQWALSRSEEHTSELQSRENLVCRLLL